LNSNYFYQLTASGQPPFTWGIFTDTGGPSALPPGLNLDSKSGIISGVPTQTGIFNVTIQVSDTAQQFATKPFMLTVVAPPPVFTTAFLPDGVVGTSYSQKIGATSGTPPYTFSQQGSPFNPSAGLPPGLVMDTGGNIAGTPTTQGTYTFTVVVTDSAGASASRSFTINIVLPLTIVTNSPLPSGTVAVYYSQTITASGGTSPYQFSVTKGALPSGFTLTADGSLTGTPSQPGTFSFTVQVTDAAKLTATKDFQLNILNYVAALQVAPSSLSFTGAANGDTVAQTLTIISTSGQPVNFSLQVDSGQANTPAPSWLKIAPTAGSTPGRITVTANPSSLTAGSYNGRIRVLVSNDSAQLPIDVPVTFTVANVPARLDLSPTFLRYSARAQAAAIIDQIIVVRNAGSGPLGFNVSIPSPAPPWLISVTPTTGQATANSPVYVRVRVNPQGLGVGGYRGLIRFNSLTSAVDVSLALFVSDAGPILGVDIVGARFEARQGNGTSEPQTVNVFNFGDPSSTVNWTADIVNGSQFVNLSPTSGTATATNPGVLTITANSNVNSLPPGGSYALVRISDPRSLNSPQYVPVTIDIVDAVRQPRPDPIPKGVVFTGIAGGTAPAARQVRVYASTSSATTLRVSAATSDGGNWLSASPASASISTASPALVTVSANLATLKTGVYTGNVNLAIGAEVRSINVTLIVTSAGTTPAGFAAREAGCTPTRLVLTHNGLPDSFSVPAGFPATVSVFLNDDCGAPVTTGSAVASFSNGDPALSLRSDQLTGLYSSTWQPGKVTSQTTVTVQATSGSLLPATAQITGSVNSNSAPVLFPRGTVNAFYRSSGVLAPGTVAEVYGSSLATSTVSPPLPLPFSLNSTSLLIGGASPPLFFLSSGQLNVQIPIELQGGRQYQIIVSANGAITLPDTLDMNPVQPGVLAFDDGHTVAQRPGDGTLVDATRPAKAGEILTLYLLGMGATNPAVPTGQLAPAVEPLARATAQPVVTVNGQSAEIFYAGLTPMSIGLYQINFRVPNNAPAGDLDLVVTQNGVPANPTKLRVGP
jgi:uncharacterized protein (TIGR03437 family)